MKLYLFSLVQNQAKLSTMQVNSGVEIDGYHQDIRRDALNLL